MGRIQEAVEPTQASRAGQGLRVRAKWYARRAMSPGYKRRVKVLVGWFLGKGEMDRLPSEMEN